MIRLTNNIEIVAQYVTDEEYKYLKSDFKLMKSYNPIFDTLQGEKQP